MSVRRPPGRVLGIDLGQRRIGLAISDPDRRVATPDRVIARTRDAERDRALTAASDVDIASL